MLFTSLYLIGLTIVLLGLKMLVTFIVSFLSIRLGVGFGGCVANLPILLLVLKGF